jgi:UDP-4-amino-4-deoxy-L-arabinose formyltransferase/UDP-glucuronic acid dehydrogenase (UDP-4-keto-hexauronic acid decarboxylating)
VKFAALGRTRMLHDSIVAATAAGHRLALVGTCAASPEYSVNERDFEALARIHGVPFFCDPRAERHLHMLKASRADVAISMNWLTVMSGAVLTAFPHGVLNAHAGDLPRYRGNACPNWAILQGEREVVLTLHRMTEELDAGPILLQRACPLHEDTYVGDVYEFMERAVPQMFVELLRALEAGEVSARPQSEHPGDALRCLPRMPRDHLIDWSHPASQLARLVRASSEPFDGAFTHYGAERLTVWRARAVELASRHLGRPGQVISVDRQRGEVVVLTGGGALALQQISLGGASRQRAADVITSTRTRLGLDLAEELGTLRERVAVLERLLDGKIKR